MAKLTTQFTLHVDSAKDVHIFLLCFDGLSNILRKRIQDGTLHRVKATRQGLVIYLFIFANDSLLFTTAKLEECKTILNCLEIYENASGQKLNLGKLVVVFNLNCCHEISISI